MSEDRNSGDKPTLQLHGWKRVAALVGLAALVAFAVYYRSHPQLLQHQFGTLGIELFGFGLGGYFVFTAITGLRSGLISGTYTPAIYKRSENAPMFWFLVVGDFAFGGFFVIAAAGLLLGVFSA